MVIASPRKVVVVQHGREQPLSGPAGWDEVSLSMSELCLHLRAATYATTSRLTTQNLAWFDQLFESA